MAAQTYFTMDTAEVLRHLTSDGRLGLTGTAAQRRLAQTGRKKLLPAAQRSLAWDGSSPLN